MEGSKMLSSAATSIFRRKEAAAKPAHCIAFRVRERKGRARQHALTEERRDGAVENEIRMMYIYYLLIIQYTLMKLSFMRSLVFLLIQQHYV